MDLKYLYDTVENCPCGYVHSCDIKYVNVSHGAIDSLKTVLGDFSSAVLVADINTYAACGDKVKSVISEKIKAELIYRPKGLLIPNEDAVDSLLSVIQKDTDVIVGVGSGVINDICKYTSNKLGIEYVIVATAPSMDGYASKGAAMIWDGMKETFNAHVPYAIIADTSVLKDAPKDMIIAGYGDIIGKYSALNDWKLASAVHNEYFCPKIYGIMMDAVERTVPLANGLMNGSEESVGILMESLVIAGVAMAFAGNSRPASGSEHHLSHFFEITGIVKGREYFPHGIDVVYSTYVTALLRESLLNVKPPFKSKKHNAVQWKQDIESVYGRVADGVIALQNKMGRYDSSPIATYEQKWDEIRSILSEHPSAERIKMILDGVGLDLAKFESMYSNDIIYTAIKYAKDLKDRYTVLWLYNELVG